MRGAQGPHAPRERKLTRARPRRLRRLLIGAALLAALPLAAIRFATWWISASDEPAPADFLVSLAGGYHRTEYAAELVTRGLAPEAWISRPRVSEEVALLARYGVAIPREEDVNRIILLKKGVPASAIHVYGDGVPSTYSEILAFREAAHPGGKRVLAVTSRFHVRRTRIILRRLIPGADIRVVATPYESFASPWWKDQDLARNTVLEMAKLAYFLAGGRFLTSAQAASAR
ncbi:MAG TPA: ElyC/SanA/YdcF family protein [Elusimicrobiota bacterium]|nr:ElyC/SanA/YdcF family protein [Elusimicrobiota bacterium]